MKKSFCWQVQPEQQSNTDQEFLPSLGSFFSNLAPPPLTSLGPSKWPLLWPLGAVKLLCCCLFLGFTKVQWFLYLVFFRLLPILKLIPEIYRKNTQYNEKQKRGECDTATQRYTDYFPCIAKT